MKDDSRKMARLARHLEATGRTVFACNLRPNLGQVPVEELASQLQAYLGTTLPGEERFDLVGFSMGGLVSRYYLQRLGGLGRVRRFVTISTPHRGSLMAYLVGNTGCRQMRPGSPFLKDLERDAALLEQAAFTSLWSPLDLIILPANSSVIPQARCHKIWCLAHPFMVSDRRCLRAVEEALV